VSPAAATQIRLAEVLAALSLTTDLGAGRPFEKGLRTCVVASSLASAVRLSTDLRRAVFHAALLRSVGCTAQAPENAAMFGDDLQFERAFKELDPADMATFSARFGDWDPLPDAQVSVRGVYVFRIVDGRIVEVWDNLDNLNVVQQLGSHA